MTKAQQRFHTALRRVRKGSKFTTVDAIELSGLSSAQVRKHLESLVNQGVVEITRPGRRGIGGVGQYRRVQ